VTFNGITSSDIYQSPYITSSTSQNHSSSFSQSNQANLTPLSPNFDYAHEPNGHNQSHNNEIGSGDMPQPQSAHADANTYDPMFSMPAQFDNEDDHLPHKQPPSSSPGLKNQTTRQQMTPTDDQELSAAGSAQADGDGDPFLSLLEQLAENEQSRGGPSELDFFLSGG
jgi:hypothetical protein